MSNKPSLAEALKPHDRSPAAAVREPPPRKIKTMQAPSRAGKKPSSVTLTPSVEATQADSA